MAQTTAEWVRGFIDERIDCLRRGDFPSKLPSVPGTLVVHVVPTLSGYSLSPAAMAACDLRVPRIIGRVRPKDHSLGRLEYAESSYSLLFHNGAIESAVVFPVNVSEHPVQVYGRPVETAAREAIENSIKGIRSCDIPDPLLVCIRLLGMTDAVVAATKHDDPFRVQNRPYGQDILEIPYDVFKGDQPDQSLDVLLKPMFEWLWLPAPTPPAKV